MKNESTNIMVFTIGHSTRSLNEFIELLLTNKIRILADVRTIPKSRHNPQFNSDVLAKSLQNSGIEYVGMKGLGGLRHQRPDSKNLGWRNASFRGYADYMQTEDFKNLEVLIRTASAKPIVVMCAEAVPWRCHRSLMADALSVRGFDVFHIVSKAAPRRHALTAFANVRGTGITYPAPRGQTKELPPGGAGHQG